jgi:Domain of unknown function (DUF4136)
MSRFTTLIFAILTVCCTACSGVTYRTESVSPDRLGKATTFSIVSDWSGKANVRIHPKAMKVLNNRLNNRLQKLGYTRAYPGTPDFIVTYRIEAEWDPSLTDSEIRQKLGFSGSRFPDADPRARNYQTLSLIVEVASPNEKRLLWRGKASGFEYHPGDSGYGLVGLCEKLLGDFPHAN